MKLDVAWTIGGDLVIGDADDESAPLVTIKFHNEADREISDPMEFDKWANVIKRMMLVAGSRANFLEEPRVQHIP